MGKRQQVFTLFKFSSDNDLGVTLGDCTIKKRKKKRFKGNSIQLNIDQVKNMVSNHCKYKLVFKIVILKLKKFLLVWS